MIKQPTNTVLALTAAGFLLSPTDAVQAEALETTNVLVIDTGLPTNTVLALTAAGVKLALTDNGHLIAMKTDNTGHVYETYDASFDRSGLSLIFSATDMTLSGGLIKTSTPRVAHALTDSTGRILSIDPRAVALALAENVEAVPIIVMIEGDEVTFLPSTLDKSSATLKTVVILGKAFGVFESKGNTIVAKLLASGKTWIADGNIGRFDGDSLVNIDADEIEMIVNASDAPLVPLTAAGHGQFTSAAA